VTTNIMGTPEDPRRALLVHYLAALAYRTQKALRGAPAEFALFEAGNQSRPPKELVRHMTSVLGYARTCFAGGTYAALPLPTIADEIRRFHEVLQDLGRLLTSDTPLRGVTEEQLLQGPFADAMTHAGQLALLRRLAGVPIPPESFIDAAIRSDRLGPEQSAPVTADADCDDLAARFNACTIPHGEWTHLAHLTVGLWHVHHYGKVEALERLRAGIRRLNESHGTANSETSGYHETTTRAYVELLSRFDESCPKATRLAERVACMTSGWLADRSVLLHFYSRETLMSVRARAEWVAPDVAPLRLLRE
jgi:hypothetical protein